MHAATQQTGYEKIKSLKKNLKCNIPDLIVLAKQNDPFYIGNERTTEMGKWFKNIWAIFGYTNGVHLRRVYYQIISQETTIKKHDGTNFTPTESDWQYLNATSKYARYLGLMDPSAIIDRRNPEPHIYSFGSPHHFSIDFGTGVHRKEEIGVEQLEYSYELENPLSEISMPYIDSDLSWELHDWKLPYFVIKGGSYDEKLQPYHIEVWSEKSTMDDVLVPLCKFLHVDYVTGLGFMSITAVIKLLQERVREHQKPTRILYISDYDPAGDAMPIAVSRQIEYWLGYYDFDFDIKLNPIVLTGEQVKQYHLPRAPIKESDKRKANFEETHGEGAVELDALEALYPGKLERIAKEEILKFRDADLESKFDESEDDFVSNLQTEWQEKIEPFQDELDEIKEKVQGICESYKNHLEELDKQLQDELSPINYELKKLWQAIQKNPDGINVEIPDIPTAETPPEDEGWLFDSNRSYLDQLEFYKRKKRGEN